MHSWLDYCNAPNTIYVNQRHREAHYAALFRRLQPYLPARSDAVILDWGCGDALAAPNMAASAELLLFDAAPTTRDRLRRRYQGHSRIKVVDENGVRHLKPASVDLILVVSVFQYLDEVQLNEAFEIFHGLLKSDGVLLVGDIIDPTTPKYAHVASLLTFALRGGFFLAAAAGLVKTFLSSYRKLEREAGFGRFSETEFLGHLVRHGFAGERLARNVAVSPLRSSYLVRKGSDIGTLPGREQAHGNARL